MTDETRDAPLMAVAELAINIAWSKWASQHGAAIADSRVRVAHDLLARARHEQERPEDRG